MNSTASKDPTVTLENYGIKNKNIHYQLSPEALRALILKSNEDKLVTSGALAIDTVEFTGLCQCIALPTLEKMETMLSFLDSPELEKQSYRQILIAN